MLDLDRRTKNALLWTVVAAYTAIVLWRWYESLGPMRWIHSLWLTVAAVAALLSSLPPLRRRSPTKLRHALLFGLVGSAIGITAASKLTNDLQTSIAEWIFLVGATVVAVVHYSSSPGDPYTPSTR